MLWARRTPTKEPAQVDAARTINEGHSDSAGYRPPENDGKFQPAHSLDVKTVRAAVERLEAAKLIATKKQTRTLTKYQL